MSTALIYLALMLLAQAAPGSLSELLGNPDRFYGQPVIVSGTISNVRESGWRRPIYTFDLSDGTQTVLVIAFGRPPCRSGAVTVEGTFEETKRRVKASYSYEKIMARNVTCLPDREQEPK
jgi:hypothetical protein